MYRIGLKLTIVFYNSMKEEKAVGIIPLFFRVDT